MFGLNTLLEKIIGTKSSRAVKKYSKYVKEINALEPKMQALSDEELCAKTDEFKNQLAQGKTLEDILVPAFAVVREASKRVLNMRHFDVQLIGGINLHEGRISEMRTGEGKTLVATLPTYLNALTGKGVHIVTVNDYLAERDAQQMGKVHRFLGLTIGCITNNMDNFLRKEAYACDITYGTNNEFGFDFLRDNLVYDINAAVQRGHNYAIVDEIDSILIDEARTPLIISGALENQTNIYNEIADIIRNIKPEYYDLDEENKSVTFSDTGIEWLENQLTEHNILKDGMLYDAQNIVIYHHCAQSLKAFITFAKDKEYIVKDGKIVIIDEFTGRMMDGRRFSEGLHQAIEAKEGVDVQPENQTLASVTYQNYFRLYKKISGMTGTAATEEKEFIDSYNLHVVSIPTNLPVLRIDEQDQLYRTDQEKYKAIIDEITEARKKGQPVLVGTTSIEKSETISNVLNKESIQHNVLNARFHEQEAHIIAQAGRFGAVTISTNMAGRGTDIQLGGNLEMKFDELPNDLSDEERKIKIEAIKNEILLERQKVLEAGGLYVIGTERHESRRIDNQLRGRSGRQGDPGRSKFFLSLDDDLLRIFGGEKLKNMLGSLGMEEGQAIASGMISKAVMKAQKKIEERNYDMRKHLLKYDNIINEQRVLVFEWRQQLLNEDNHNDTFERMLKSTVNEWSTKYCNDNTSPDQWQFVELQATLLDKLNVEMNFSEWLNGHDTSLESLKEYLFDYLKNIYITKVNSWEGDLKYRLEKEVLLKNLDKNWREHLYFLEHLGKNIGMRGFTQKDPLLEFSIESQENFEKILKAWRLDVIEKIFKIEVRYVNPEDFEHDEVTKLEAVHKELEQFSATENIDADNENIENLPNDMVSRNSPCPCGSGLKYKHCHGKIAV
jgi:preprotein translocase subunit SecA